MSLYNLQNSISANFLPQVEPHAAKLESCAAGMEAAGIGGDMTNGHAVILRRMAASMRADAAQGRLPSTMHAAGDAPAPQIAALNACKDAGVEVPHSGRFASLEALDASLHAAFDKQSVGYFEKRISLKNQIIRAGLLIEQKQKPVDEGAIRFAANLLRKHRIPFDGEHMYTVDDINAAMAKAELTPVDRIEVKVACERAGLLDTAGTTMSTPMPGPSINAARLVFRQLDLDPPAPGQKIAIAALNRAIREKGFDAVRSIEMKSTLHAAGLLAD
jgi:hypothetical protein